MEKGDNDETSPTANGHMEIWIAQVLEFTRIQIWPNESSLCMENSKIQWPFFNPQLEQVLALLQYYEFHLNKDLKSDWLDKGLICFRISWQRKEGVFENSTSGNQYGPSHVD